MAKSLWGEEFVIEPTQQQAKAIIKKVKEAKEPKVVTQRSLKSDKIPISEKIAAIRNEVHRILGRYEDATQVITSREELHNYIVTAIQNGIIAIDTETNNTIQPVGCKLMGACIYTPTLKNVYIPINHINYQTGEKLKNQLTEQDVYEEFSLLDGIEIITHNGKFDYQVLKYSTGWKMPIAWDTMIAAKLLNENESAALKYLYKEYIDPTIEKYSIDHLFENMPYEIFEPSLFALYAATDAYMTYKLYEYQKKEFNKADNKKIYKLFKDIEMPDVEVFAEMEYTGVELSLEYADRLKDKYGRMLSRAESKVMEEIAKYKDTISAWRLTSEANYHPPKKGKIWEFDKSLSEKLQDPINISSPLQLSILFYDVLNVPVLNKKTPRSTDSETLKQLNLPVCKALLEYRGLMKLISTYIEALPQAVNPVDGRVHTKYNQLGARTGRVSSDNPNL